MLIILEGCDGTGKTTLANNLAQFMDAEIIHCTKETQNDYEFFSNIIYASREKNIIADRFCYGQFVYQQEEDRPLSNLSWGSSEQVLKALEIQLKIRGAVIVNVVAPTEVIEKRLAERGETLINGLSVEQVVDRFNQVFSRSILPVKVYNAEGQGGFIQ